MPRGMVFFTLALVCVWLILDDFFGKGRVSTLAALITPNLSAKSAIVTAVKKNQKLDVGNSWGSEWQKIKKKTSQAMPWTPHTNPGKPPITPGNIMR